MGELTGTVRPRENLARSDIDQLYALFERHYSCVSFADFARDLAEKDWVLELRDSLGAVRGFTTMKLYERRVLGRPLRAVFNGNTIIDPAFWGEQELVRVWCRFMAGLEAMAPEVPLYWYLICSGYRTYLFLPLFFESFHPKVGVDGTTVEGRLCDYFGQLKFPREYREGVVHVTKPRECLLPELAVPSEAKLRNPHVRFFVERNPGYLRGDELVCMAEFSVSNTRRMARQALLEVAARAC